MTGDGPTIDSMVMYEQTTARCLVVGDAFVPAHALSDSQSNGNWAWTVREHQLTERGDYSTIVESDGTEWTERFNLDDVVWLVRRSRVESGYES